MAQGRIRIAVMFGGRSGEHEVSLVSAASVINTLDPARYEVVPVGVTRAGRWYSAPDVLTQLRENRIPDPSCECVLVPEPGRPGLLSLANGGQRMEPLDVVFPLIHGTYGEDGTLQGLLELAEVPYVGAGVLGSSVGMDKVVQKQLFVQAGLHIAKYTWALAQRCQEAPRAVVVEVEKALRYPVFVKPANTGSSVGITKAHTRKELIAGMELAASYDRKVVFEQGIAHAREIECSVLGNDMPEASLPGEIVPSNEFYDYDAKYVDGKSAIFIPAPLPRAAITAIKKLAVQAYRAIDCAGMARADFFYVARTKKVYINELNTIPGFTSISMYPKMWEASGLPFSRLLDRLVDLARERHAAKMALRRTYDPSKEWYRP
jgi:D-alanine-D-alanine ligase